MIDNIIFENTIYSYSEINAYWDNWIEESFNIPDTYFTYKTLNFYVSSYVCPECKKNMLKTVFPFDLNFRIVEGNVSVSRVFICEKCKTLHIPSPGYKLSRNNGFYKKLDPKTFEEFVYFLDSKGSIIGRQGTLYNENNG